MLMQKNREPQIYAHASKADFILWAMHQYKNSDHLLSHRRHQNRLEEETYIDVSL